MNNQEPMKTSSGERRSDWRFGLRYLLSHAILAIPPGVVMVIMWAKQNEPDAVAWPFILFFVLWIAGWIALDVSYLRRYRCPNCGERIRQPTIVDREAGDPIRYCCHSCGVEWDTRLRESGEL